MKYRDQPEQVVVVVRVREMIRIDPLDCTQKEFVEDLTRIIYRRLGSFGSSYPNRLFRSVHPTERAALHAAEDIFECLTGDYPDYADEDPEND